MSVEELCAERKMNDRTIDETDLAQQKVAKK